MITWYPDDNNTRVRFVAKVHKLAIAESGTVWGESWHRLPSGWISARNL